MLTLFFAAPLVAAHLATGAHVREVSGHGVVVRAVAREVHGETEARLEIRRGRAVQTIDLHHREIGALILLQSIAIVDVNFDGHPDVTVLRELGAKWGASDAFVFDPRTSSFTSASRIARAIGNLTNATFDEKHQTITTRNIGPSNPERITYAVERDRLRVVSSCRFLNPFDARVGTLVRTTGRRTTYQELRLGASDLAPCD